jgi:hypothetical protein
VVFTLPEEIAAIAFQNKAVVYNLLFAATAETLRTIAAKCGEYCYADLVPQNRRARGFSPISKCAIDGRYSA